MFSWSAITGVSWSASIMTFGFVVSGSVPVVVSGSASNVVTLNNENKSYSEYDDTVGYTFQRKYHLTDKKTEQHINKPRL